MITPQEDQQLTELSKRIVTLYREVKGYVIASEKLSSGARVSIPALNELRNAFDHYMRAEYIWKHGAQPGEGAEPDIFKYCEKNLQKALGHVYRAGYDALDIIALNKVRQIEKYSDGYRLTTFHTVISDYAVCIRAPFEKGIKQCDEAKKGKDIEAEQIREHSELFANYKEGINALESVLHVLHKHDKDLLGVEEEVTVRDKNSVDKYRKQRNWAICGIVITIITAVGAILLTILIQHNTQ